ncbi:tRNA pseudouridine(38/39) synthase-like isoform X2 [Artemia franciscana]|uniref:tRNA pseudouridine(38/39) synthase-like isoform X1 n=1 Tax=Artemia franciscana TaxID=6661 RepID=UPI0032D9D2CC
MAGISNNYEDVFKKRRELKKSELNLLDKDELITKVIQLQAQNEQLQRLVYLNEKTEKNTPKKKKEGRQFNFTKFAKRHVFLQIAYLGWDYLGYVTQDHSERTIEAELFKALTKTCLIESRETANYHRCGRTDKGVSAFFQVISIDLRSQVSSSLGVYIPEGHTAKDEEEEMDYIGILNRVLPKEIQVIAWAPVEQGLSSRFDCKKRTYKYFFPKADLDIQAMREASQYLLGTHDFRNFCKMDVGNGVINYTRNILQLTIDAPTGDDSYNMCELTIQGQAFLWHQVRCVVAILFLIGQRKENPDLVKELLDVDKNPRKPQYSMASEIPLILFDSSYEGIEWKHNQQSLKTTIKHFQELWCNYAVRATMLNKIMATLSSISVPGNLEMNKLNSQILIEGVESKVYKPIMKRQLCDSLEQKMEHFAKRFKHKN